MGAGAGVGVGGGLYDWPRGMYEHQKGMYGDPRPSYMFGDGGLDQLRR